MVTVTLRFDQSKTSPMLQSYQTQHAIANVVAQLAEVARIIGFCDHRKGRVAVDDDMNTRGRIDAVELRGIEYLAVGKNLADGKQGPRPAARAAYSQVTP